MRRLSSQVKIRQIPYVNFETTSQFLFRFFIILQCHYNQRLCKFSPHAFSTLDKRTPWKYQFWYFQKFWWKFPKFLMSFSKPQISFSSNFAWFFNVRMITPLYFFRSNVIYFAQKRQSKCKFLRLLSAQIKIHQILVIFETTNWSFLTFCTILQCHETWLSVLF